MPPRVHHAPAALKQLDVWGSRLLCHRFPAQDRLYTCTVQYSIPQPCMPQHSILAAGVGPCANGPDTSTGLLLQVVQIASTHGGRMSVRASSSLVRMGGSSCQLVVSHLRIFSPAG
jgi:hypothetical protein